ncbi:MAG TPA: hypothetical protein VLI05_00695 [Candidatus Saccharimonadia bacterium]|nr:hypothetical protein [Candidatus Saccharimonadia bacterium]
MTIRNSKHISLVAKLALAVGVALLVLGLGFGLWLHSLSFQAYKPGKLPSNLVVTSHTIIISKQGSGDGGYLKTITYLTNQPEVTIGEQKSSPTDHTNRLFSCAEHLTNTTCTTHMSPHHQTYSVQTAFDSAADGTSGQPFDQTISWLRGDTLIWITLEGRQAQAYDAQSWGAVIDDFSPVNFGLELTHVQSPSECESCGG